MSLSTILFFVHVFQLYSGQSVLNERQSNRYAAYLLADQLCQTSDDLTRLARPYAVTGDPAYEQQYMDILDIRNGKKPRPEAYFRIYWYFVAADGKSRAPIRRRSRCKT